MKRVVIVGLCFLLITLCVAPGISAQDFSALLKAVDKVETNLRGGVETARAARTTHFNKINKLV